MSGCLHILAQAEQPPGGAGESLGPLFTWLVFMVIWVIVQLKQRHKKKSSAQPLLEQEGPGSPQGTEQESAKPVEAELRNFMNELLGTGPPRDTGPAPARPPHRARAQAHRDTVDSDRELFARDLREVQDPPAPQGQRPPPLPQPEPAITFDPAPEDEDDIFDEEKVYGGLKDITDIVDIELALEGAAISDAQNLINPSNFIVDLATLSVPIMSTQMISQRPVRTKSSRPRLTTRKTFRSAVIGRLILGPPTALSEDVFRSNPGDL